jgi:CheY-like chemotaxis protein
VKAFKLLVVDDSIVDRRLLCNELVDLGHLCEEAKDGLEALARIAASCPINADGTTSPPTEGRTDEYDAILMDFDMPNMDGPTATRELREMGFKGVIFGMVGKAVPKDIEKFKESGVSKVFTKPLNVDVFVQTMNTIAK